MTQKALDVKKIQDEIKKEGLDGWLFYDFRGLDALGLKILNFKQDMIRTRRWYYFIPAEGEPRKLCHRIELSSLDHLPGDEKTVYLSWKELQESLRKILSGSKRIAMQYSRHNVIPYVSKVDAGTFGFLESLGLEIVSSANLVQTFEAVLSTQELKSHLAAAKSIRSSIDEAFCEIGRAVKSKEGTDEYKIQQFICSRLESDGMQIEELPIVAVNEHAADPHYEPTAQKHSRIKEGDLVLLDVFARKKGEESIIADYTWMGYVGTDVPAKMVEVFNVVRDARDKAYEFVRDSLAQKKEICGYQIDDVTRNYITQKGYGEYFIHRTGHSIGRMVHGNGANIDNLETRDERRIVNGLCFSVEPGIYLKDFGVRSEINVYIENGEAKISGLPVQTEIVKIA